ncbi:hypothetical protein NP493_4374g00000 [Ridgeia piscesae]|uniref:Uncharacterized protein n=1 Tax=Ridgeia piscesae TaxID=27915 RepID=A0AAD9J095_RIDPI|nr:hypothetical protein NP493_4374g00000 [Ridgeia piscesae]
MDKVKGADEVKEAGVVNGDVVAPLAKQEDEELSSVEEQLELGDDDWPDSIADEDEDYDSADESGSDFEESPTRVATWSATLTWTYRTQSQH